MRRKLNRILIRTLRFAAMHTGVLISVAATDCSLFGAENGATSIPVANVPLLGTSDIPWQKATSSDFVPTDTVELNWNIPISSSLAGVRKPYQTQVHSRTEPAIIRQQQLLATQDRLATILPQCEGISGCVDAMSIVDGERKPVVPSGPLQGPVAHVSWSVQAASSPDFRNSGPTEGFHADWCPQVLWNPDSPGEFLGESILDSAPVGSCSEFVGVQDRVGRAYLPAIASKTSNGIDARDLAELQELAGQTAPVASSRGSYISDLNQLVQGNSNWLFANPAVLDLAPHEPETRGISYLDELNHLAKTVHSSVSTEHLATIYRQDAQADAVPPAQPPRRPRPSGKPSQPYTGLAPEQGCEPGTGQGVGALFEPLASIRVTGLSSAPPEKDESSAILRRPDNSACAYLDAYVPAHYFVPQRFCYGRPFRNTHVLYHNPLYFEDPNLERCGQSHGCLTTAVSAAYFATAITFVPYLTAADCPGSCVRALPDCPTCHEFGHDAYTPGWSWKGAAAQAGAVTGLIFIVP